MRTQPKLSNCKKFEPGSRCTGPVRKASPGTPDQYKHFVPGNRAHSQPGFIHVLKAISNLPSSCQASSPNSQCFFGSSAVQSMPASLQTGHVPTVRSGLWPGQIYINVTGKGSKYNLVISLCEALHMASQQAGSTPPKHCFINMHMHPFCSCSFAVA